MADNDLIEGEWHSAFGLPVNRVELRKLIPPPEPRKIDQQIEAVDGIVKRIHTEVTCHNVRLASELQDALYHDVLRLIASGKASDPVALAEHALRSLDAPP